jgi:Alkylmercury lyase
MRRTTRLEVLHVRDCPNVGPMLERLRQVTDLPVASREIGTAAEAAATGMAGSPTLLVDGVDPFAGRSAPEPGLSCRIYRDGLGRTVPVPSVEQLRDAVPPDGSPMRSGGDLLAAWRAKASPEDPDEAELHRAILRAFATGGRPPAREHLNTITAGGRRSTADLLDALHRRDAICLDANGDIAVAYPFSAVRTRHRVRLDGRTDVYAMCAVDALGMSGMLAVDTRIDSTDPANGLAVTVLTTAGETTWTPSTAVAVIGTDAGGGPSADCCCDYLNFFTDPDTAVAWLDDHPWVPGQVLTQDEAEDLAVRLFGHLLADGRGGEPS